MAAAAFQPVKNDLTLVFVKHMDEVIEHLFSETKIEPPKRTKAKISEVMADKKLLKILCAR